MNHEIEVLLLCSRSNLKNAQLERVKTLVLKKDFDWNQLVLLANRHRVLPLVHKSLKCAEKGTIPECIDQYLKSVILRNTAHNLLLVKTLLNLLFLFKENDIQVLPFKGPILTATVYGNIGLRSYVDLDLLIPAKDMKNAVSLLIAHDYEVNFSLTFGKYMKLISWGEHAHLVNAAQNVVVELHWEMTRLYLDSQLQFEDIVPYLKTVLFFGCNVNSLCSEILLVYLCLHGNRHVWPHLDSICCVAELINSSPELDWKQVLSFAQRIGARRMVFLGLLLAYTLLNVQLPPDVLGKIEDEPKLRVIAAKIEGELFDLNGQDRGKLGYVEVLFYHYQTLDNFSEFVKYCRVKFFVPDGNDMEWVALPPFLWFLYPFIRSVRLFFESCRAFIIRL